MSQIHLTRSIPVTLRTDFVENTEGRLSDRQHIITRSRNSCENHERHHGAQVPRGSTTLIVNLAYRELKLTTHYGSGDTHPIDRHSMSSFAATERQHLVLGETPLQRLHLHTKQAG
jgi:hypothetical protein